MSTPLELQLLGKPRIALGAEFALPTRKALALLAYVALAGPAPRAKLAALLWSDQPDDEARRNLRQELHRLNATPAGTWLNVTGDGVSLRDGADIDVNRLRAAADARDSAQVVQLYRGPLLETLEVKGAAGLADWLSAEREAIARLWRNACIHSARDREQQGDLAGALQLVRALLSDDPLQETFHREAMRLLNLLGDRDAALAQYEACRKLLRAELALEPLAETTALAQRVRLAQEQSSQPAAGATLPELKAPLIGRDEAWMRLGAAAGKLALIEGEAGVGKSRLAEEFARAAGAVVSVKGREISRGTPLYPIAEALLQAYRADTRWFERLDPVWQSEVARLVPALAEAETRSELPVGEARGRFIEGLTSALLTAAASGTLLLDDLQWLDAASAELVAHLVQRAHRVRLIATARSDELAGNSAMQVALDSLARDGALVRVPIAPLTEAEVLALVRALSGSASAVVFSRRLFEATAGNPLFILESLRDLFSAGILRREEGTWATPYDDATRDYRELPISATAREAVLRRIDRLGAPVRRMIEAASLAGDGFEPEWLGACTALSELELVDAVDLAARANLIEPAARGYRFSHDLVRRSLDDALSPARRKLLHRHLAVALEAANRAAADIARHLEAAGRGADAMKFRERAAEAASRVYDAREALAQYAAALADGAGGRDAFRIHAACVDHLRNLNDLAGWEAALAAMQALEPELGDAAASVEVAVRRSVYCFDTGRFAEGLAVTQDAEQKLHGRISEFDEARLLLEMGATLRALGRIDEAQARLTTALERFRDTSPLKHGNTAYWLCICALGRNDLDAAERWSQIAMDATAATGHRRGHAMSLWTRAEIAHKRGDRIGAVELIEQALAEAREIGSVWIQREVLEALIARLREYGCAEDADRRQGELDVLGRG